MLEKDKDYVEFILRCTSVEMGEDKCHCEVGFNGYSNDDFPCMPMDVVCKEFDHKVVLVSKRDFDRLQADNEHYRELAKQREENYNLLLKKIGFDSVIEFENFLVRMGKKEDGSHKTVKEILQEIDPISFEVLLQQEHTIYEWKELTGCSTPEEAKSVIEFGESRYHAYNKINEKFEQLQTENEQLKKKLQVPDPIPEYKELLEKLYSKDDAENLEWTLNHICGGQASVNGWMVTAKLWRRNYETLSKLVGFSSVEEIQDYLTNEAECDTLHEAISKLHDQVKYTCDEWYSANSRNNSWKAAAECNSPKELIEKLSLLRDDISGRSTVIDHYKCNIEKWQKATGCLRPEDISTASLVTKAMQLDQEVKILNGALQEWKEGTGCPSPSSAKALIESGMSYEYAYHEAQEENRKLTEEVDSWKNVTGYSTPEDYMHARINCATPFDYTAAWQKVTGFSTPEKCSSYIDRLEKKLEDIKNLTEED